MKRLALLLLSGLVGCEVTGATTPIDPAAPTNLSFQLSPSGDPNVPLGILLTWVPPSNGRAVTFDVYGLSNSTGWIRRATTTSPSFHDAGVPQAQYYVAAIDDQGAEMGRSAIVTVDLTNRLPAPLGLTSTTLNSAIQLSWSDNAVQAGGSTFDHYRVYSSDYSSAQGGCIAPWSFEGSTVSDAFIAGNLTNGVRRCFTVSAISVDGHESIWSDARLDTPRLDARSALVYVGEARTDSAAFVFNDEVAKKFGIVGATTRTDADFTVNRLSDGTVWMTPARSGSMVRAYATTTLPDLTSIDRAPPSGYQATAIQAAPGIGYVFRLDEADGTHYGAMRVQYVAKDFVVFDWAYQIGVGNPELSAGRAVGGQ
jgi:hypothetical protein